MTSHRKDGLMGNGMAERFSALFSGLPRVRGIWNKGKMSTEMAPVELKHYQDHLNGKVGIGVVPIRDDNTCMFGCVDIDAHGQTEEVPIDEILHKITERGYPLVPCRSKSGGAHLYLFFREPAKAKAVRSALSHMASQLGYGKSEIFPKQEKIEPTQQGSWINLPYFDARATVRYAVMGEKANHLTFEQFLDKAESLRVVESDLKLLKKAAAGDGPWDDAPPCIRHLVDAGIKEGYGIRNEGMFNIAVYLYNRYPKDWEERVFSTNYDKTIMEKELPKREVEALIGSVRKANYHYRCNQPPMSDYCDRTRCLGLRYGVKLNTAFGTFRIGQLQKLMTNPPRWTLTINDVPIDFTTEQIMDFRAVQAAMFERLNLVAAPMKNTEWCLLLQEKLDNRVEINAPDDASPSGMIMSKLKEFVARARRGQPSEKKEELLRGMPCLVEDDGKRYIYFRGPHFVEFLRKRKAEDVKGNALWQMLRAVAGAEHKKIRVGGEVTPVWFIPDQPQLEQEITVPEPVEDDSF